MISEDSIRENMKRRGYSHEYIEDMLRDIAEQRREEEKDREPDEGPAPPEERA